MCQFAVTSPAKLTSLPTFAFKFRPVRRWPGRSHSDRRTPQFVCAYARTIVCMNVCILIVDDVFISACIQVTVSEELHQFRFGDIPVKFQVGCPKLSPKRDCSPKRVKMPSKKRSGKGGGYNAWPNGWSELRLLNWMRGRDKTGAEMINGMKKQKQKRSAMTWNVYFEYQVLAWYCCTWCIPGTW